MSYLKVFSQQWILRAVALSVAVALTGCASAPSALSPVSSNAQQISDLFWPILIIASAVFLIVEGLLLYAVVRYRSKQRDRLPNQITGNRRLEVAWTLVPAVILAAVYIMSLQTLGSVASQPVTPTTAASATGDPPNQPLHVRVIGHQWWWEFDYPDLHITTANELHVPVGVDVDLAVESIDVIHSFWVPQLGGKVDAIPGHTNHTWVHVLSAGTYHGQCAEFCGIEHALMRFNVVAEPPDQFDAWIKQQQAPVPSLAGDAAAGEQMFLTGPCIGCHTIDNTTAQGKVGPNLTHFASRSIFAGGVLPNTPEDVSRWLTDPQAVKPGTVMPNLHLGTEKVAALVAYLESLK